MSLPKGVYRSGEGVIVAGAGALYCVLAVGVFSMKEPSNIPAGKVKTNPRHIGKIRSVMRILNLKT